MQKCKVKRMSNENEGVTYPTFGSLHKAVLDTGRYPQWSYMAFREILLGMGIKMKAKGDIDRSILIEDDNLIIWRDIAYKIDQFFIQMKLILIHMLSLQSS